MGAAFFGLGLSDGLGCLGAAPVCQPRRGRVDPVNASRAIGRDGRAGQTRPGRRGASSSWSPRRPAETKIVARSSAAGVDDDRQRPPRARAG